MLSSHNWFCISAVPRQKNVMRCSGKGSLWLVSLSLSLSVGHPKQDKCWVLGDTQKRQGEAQGFRGSRLRALSVVHRVCRDMQLEKLEWRWVKGIERSGCQMKHSKEMCDNKKASYRSAAVLSWICNGQWKCLKNIFKWLQASKKYCVYVAKCLLSCLHSITGICSSLFQLCHKKGAILSEGITLMP